MQTEITRDFYLEGYRTGIRDQPALPISLILPRRNTSKTNEIAEKSPTLRTSAEHLIVVQRRLALHALPDLVNLLHGSFTQRASLQSLDSLLKLLDVPCTHNDDIAFSPIQLRVVRNPAISKFCPRNPFVLCNLLPHIECSDEARPVIHAVVHLRKRLSLSKSAIRVGQFRLGFGEKSTCDRAVGVKCHIVLANGREDFCIRATSDSGVVALIDGRHYIIVFFRHTNNFFHLVGEKVGETEPLEGTLLVQLVETCQSLLNWESPIWGMDIVNIDLVLISLIHYSMY